MASVTYKTKATQMLQYTIDDVNKVLSILEKIENSSGRLAKTEILEDNKNFVLLADIFKAASSNYDYYIAKLHTPLPKSKSDEVSFLNFLYEILPDLNSRKITGNAARAVVTDVFAQMTSLEQKWCKRIILKNLRVGLQKSTLNKIWPNLIKEFAVQLASTLEVETTQTGIKFLENINFPVRVEPKIDGLRLIAICKDGNVELFTRNGTKVDTLPVIQEMLRVSVRENIVLDGEAFSKDWNDSMSIIASHKSKKDDSSIEYNIFDAVLLNEWEAQECKMSLTERITLVQDTVNSIKSNNIHALTGIYAYSEKEITDFYHTCLENGHEGVMLKNMLAKYEFKRTKNVKKLKPFQTVEGVISGFKFGKEGSQLEGLPAGFLVTLLNGIVTDMGSGINAELRAEMHLKGVDEFLGKVVECECAIDPNTADGLTEDGKMRFPVFVRFRHEMDCDKFLLELSQKIKDKK